MKAEKGLTYDTFRHILLKSTGIKKQSEGEKEAGKEREEGRDGKRGDDRKIISNIALHR